MIKKTFTLLLLLTLLAACSTSEGDSSDGDNAGQASDTALDAAAPLVLDDDYANALSVQGQLALGTVQLEETAVAVDETQAAALLPLWQALQSLSNSDTTAQAELDAVVSQIQETMTAAQIEAIAAMALTTESMAELIESGELSGFGRGFNRGGEGATEGGLSGGGLRPGGLPGGGNPQGGGPGGGPGGFSGGFGNLSEDDIATRQAQFASGEFALEDRALLGMVVRLLQTRTGQTPEGPGAAIADTVFTIVSQTTGLSVQEIQTQVAEGSSLADVIAANGGDLATVRETLIEALAELPNAADLDVESIADNWLGEP
jgi:predicted small secreted protein